MLVAPKLNTDGAVYGTLISRTIEIISITLYIIFSKKDFKLHLGEMESLNLSFIKQALKFALPVIINEFMWGFYYLLRLIFYAYKPSKPRPEI